MSDTADFSFSGRAEVPTAEGTLLDKLRGRVSGKVHRPDVLIEVPERKGVSIQVSPNIKHPEMNKWRRQAGSDSKNGFDSLKFSCIVIAQTCTGIFVDGEEITTESGDPVSFASAEVMEMVGASRPIPDCVLAMYGVDPHVEAAAVKIMELAGWGEGVDEVDPSKT